MMNTNQYQMAFRANKLIRPPCDVFISHRSVDTKRSVASLLYHQLQWSRIPSFIDHKNMKPGDKLLEKISKAIMGCKIGIAVFSPHYCESYYCLHELALMIEYKKKVIPIFCDVKPSELQVLDCASRSRLELRRFDQALEEAKHTAGLTFDTTRGNWSDVLMNAVDIVNESLTEMGHTKNVCAARPLQDHRNTSITED